MPTTKVPRKLIFSELQRDLDLNDEEITFQLSRNENRSGFLEPEWPFLKSYFCTISDVFLLREKAYFLEITVQKTENSNCEVTQKVAMRGSVPKVRAGTFEFQDLLILPRDKSRS